MDVEIKNVGRLSNLKLENIARINYIVGENKSGKSAFLAGLVKNQHPTDMHLRGAPVKSYYRKDSDLAVTKLPQPFLTFTSKLIEPITVFSPFYGSSSSSIVNLAKKDASKNGLGIIEEQLQRKDGKPSGQIIYGFPENPEIEIGYDDAWNSVASGNKSIEYLKSKLARIDTQPRHVTFILIDEPEIHLHPKLHKQIHELFVQKIADPSFYFFITTHSSYLVASSVKKQENTKVFCLVEGRIVTSPAYWTDSKDRDRHLAQQGEGFKPSECKLLVHDILGSTLDNYFPKIIYCENSLKDFIETFCRKYQNTYELPLIIPSGGDLTVLERTNAICGIIEGLRIYQKGNINLLGPTAYAIIDKLNSEQNIEAKLVDKIIQNDPDAIIVLEEEEIERSYPEKFIAEYLEMKGLPNWDKTLTFNEYLESQKLTSKQIGIEKSLLAIYVADKITPEQFTKGFQKIDSLLKV
ncbi:MAG: AAA family ATPase [Chitinophagaceae bacterium]|nr:AAA family ATPase [Chitinophagaceae bacterium]